MKKFSKGTIITWVLAVMFLCASVSLLIDGQIGSFFVGLAITMGLAFWGWKIYVKNSIPEEDSPIILEKNVTTDNSEYEYETIKVAGVTFKNGRKSRQTILRRIKYRDEEFKDVDIYLTVQEYEFEGKVAFGIYVNDQQIGNIPADMTDWYKQNISRIVAFTSFDIVGGGTMNGEKLSYGARLKIKLTKVKEMSL